jgi:DNA-binding MarR family transcriptional regulator
LARSIAEEPDRWAHYVWLVQQEKLELEPKEPSSEEESMPAALTRAEEEVLKALDCRGPSTIKSIERKTALSRAYVAKTLALLRGKGLAESRPLRGRRYSAHRPTGRGRDLLKETKEQGKRKAPVLASGGRVHLEGGCRLAPHGRRTHILYECTCLHCLREYVRRNGGARVMAPDPEEAREALYLEKMLGREEKKEETPTPRWFEKRTKKGAP